MLLHGDGPGSRWGATRHARRRGRVPGPARQARTAHARRRTCSSGTSRRCRRSPRSAPRCPPASRRRRVDRGAATPPTSCRCRRGDVRWVHRGAAAPGHPELLERGARARSAVARRPAAPTCWARRRAMIALRAVLEARGVAHDDIFVKGYWNLGPHPTGAEPSFQEVALERLERHRPRRDVSRAVAVDHRRREGDRAWRRRRRHAGERTQGRGTFPRTGRCSDRAGGPTGEAGAAGPGAGRGRAARRSSRAPAGRQFVRRPAAAAPRARDRGSPRRSPERLARSWRLLARPGVGARELGSRRRPSGAATTSRPRCRTARSRRLAARRRSRAGCSVTGSSRVMPRVRGDPDRAGDDGDVHRVALERLDDPCPASVSVRAVAAMSRRRSGRAGPPVPRRVGGEGQGLAGGGRGEGVAPGSRTETAPPSDGARTGDRRAAVPARPGPSV